MDRNLDNINTTTLNSPPATATSAAASPQSRASAPTSPPANPASGPSNRRSQPGVPTIQCTKCELPLSGKFVRALEGCFHMDCFVCEDCGENVARRYFPFDVKEPTGKVVPLCEKDYFRRLGLLCEKCGEALRGNYVTALNKKYHLEHFTCSMCDVVFGADETYFEHDGKIFCHYHYSISHSVSCAGCRMPILRQFVEVKGAQVEQWHPECYMIFKSWNIRLGGVSTDQTLTRLTAAEFKIAQSAMEEKSSRIWSILSAFEESAAACISDMLLHVSNQCYVDAVNEAGNFIMHVDVLFTGIDILDSEIQKFNDNIGLNFSREPKMLSKKIVNFFSLLSHTQDSGSRKQGTVTQELLSLVTSLAQYLKILIRIALAGALKLERRYSHKTAIGDLLTKLAEMSAAESEENTEAITTRFDERFKLIDTDVKSDLCVNCRLSVEESCIRFKTLRWHKRCFNSTQTGTNLQDKCKECGYLLDKNLIFGPEEMQQSSAAAARGFETVSQLEQYVFLLRVALKRLYGLLKVKDDSISVSYAMFPDIKASSKMLHEQNAESSSSLNRNQPPRDSLSDMQSTPAADGTNDNAECDSQEDVPAEEVQAGHKLIEEGANLKSVHNLIESSSGSLPNSASGEKFSPPGSVKVPNQSGGITSSARNLSTSLPSLSENNVINRAKQEADSQWPVSRAGEATKIPIVDGKMRGSSMAEMGPLEVLMVHHIAILKLHPMIQEFATMNELLDVIRSRKATLWTKIISSLKPVKKPQNKDGVFGVPLDVLVEKYGVDSKYGTGQGRLRIPGIIEHAISVMKKQDLKAEGIFRKNGNIKNLQLLQEKIDTNPTKIILEKETAIQLAAMLKKFLRELPEPLMTFKLYKLFLLSQKHPHVETRKKIMHYTCCLLPKQNRDLLEVLLVFLKEVASLAAGPEGNKMDITNLSTVFAPNILYAKPKESKPEKLSRDAKEESFLAIDAVKMLLNNHEEFWTVPPEILEMLNENNDLNLQGDINSRDVLKKLKPS